MASHFTDLDELILKCRNKKVQDYISEAVLCYKAGAFRAAIVSTWTAICFDSIAKIEELSLTGDTKAKEQNDKIKKYIEENDKTGSLKFEGEILGVLKDKLDMISYIEFTDLERIKDDRNRCAHPSFTREGEEFVPSAELARLHIRNAVEILLRYPPAQGQIALKILLKKVNSDLFPQEIDDAIKTLKDTALFKARNSLIKSFIIVLLKDLSKDDELSSSQVARTIAAIKATKSMHPETYNETLESKLSDILDKAIESKRFIGIIALIIEIDDIWSFLNNSIQIQIKKYISDIPFNMFGFLSPLTSHASLSKVAIDRIKKATRDELSALKFEGDIHDAFKKRIIQLYAESGNYKTADNFSTTVSLYSEYYDEADIKNIVKACNENDQVTGSGSIVHLLKSLQSNNNIKDDFIINHLTIDYVKRLVTESEDRK